MTLVLLYAGHMSLVLFVIQSLVWQTTESMRSFLLIKLTAGASNISKPLVKLNVQNLLT